MPVRQLRQPGGLRHFLRQLPAGPRLFSPTLLQPRLIAAALSRLRCGLLDTQVVGTMYLSVPQLWFM